MKRRRMSTSLVLAALLAAPAAPAAEDRVAQLTQISGPVTIERAETAKLDEVVAAGPRVRNGAVSSGDLVSTGAGATAAMTFPDGTTVELRPMTRLVVLQRDLPASAPAGEASMPAGRTLRLLAGELRATVAPNPGITTQLETPTGLATVKGTALSLSFDGSRTVLETAEGVVAFRAPTGVELVLGAGTLAAVETTPAGSLRMSALPGSQPFEVRLPNGTSLLLGPGAVLDVTTDPRGVAHLRVEGSGATMLDGSPVPGAALSYPVTVLPPSSRATTTVETREGMVTLSASGLEIGIPAGHAVAVTETTEGTRVATPAANPGPLRLRRGSQTAAVRPGSDVTVLPSLRGLLTARTMGPQARRSSETTPGKARKTRCGPCAVTDSSGGCRDIDAFCIEPCVRDRVCRGGQCVGGRRLTSKEDPNCL